MKPSEKLIQAIREQDIKPLPKWRFTLRNSLLLAAFLLAVLLGALSFSVILFAIQQTDFNVVNHLSHSRMELFLGLLPFFWILVLVVFLAIAIYSIQYAPKGYKFSAGKWVAYSAALSMLLGTLFFIAGGAERIENAFEVNVSIYQSIEEKKVRLWSMPQDGYLAGDIIDVTAEALHLKDLQGKKWTIRYEDAFIPPVVLLERGEKVKLLGAISGKDEFTADEIRPWGGYRGGRGKGRGGPRN
jgi:hypothetical protein